MRKKIIAALLACSVILISGCAKETRNLYRSVDSTEFSETEVGVETISDWETLAMKSQIATLDCSDKVQKHEEDYCSGLSCDCLPEKFWSVDSIEGEQVKPGEYYTFFVNFGDEEDVSQIVIDNVRFGVLVYNDTDKDVSVEEKVKEKDFYFEGNTAAFLADLIDENGESVSDYADMFIYCGDSYDMISNLTEKYGMPNAIHLAENNHVDFTQDGVRSINCEWLLEYDFSNCIIVVPFINALTFDENGEKLSDSITLGTDGILVPDTYTGEVSYPVYAN